MPVTLQSVEEARRILSRQFSPTRLQAAESFPSTFLKLETELPTGSFKVRGAVYALTKAGPVREVVAASTGNHGAAVAYAARLLGIPATIFLPHGSNPVKLARILQQGAAFQES